ncbi:class I SAM-dependent methyltransferase [Oleiagrimonas sp. MCCC 1A03011]|uniref:class I SAM-dependent DNA methyltransferase n=1 Tax=Oleiagrimonas sp. MCCC 1A03011 TaxID=1926883 RepID=UPI000DC3A771|nr:class I SAM-dependent methyltransferase [Oleiagrimonas sp. MCCC 1A03011]RAP57568.1 methyltransferase [Oleiagrimonas sp. MCCC 1A03011]
MTGKQYDRAYFDKWYRDPRHAGVPPAVLKRKVALALAQAEFYLGRPVRNVLDVGCGEGPWRAVLRRMRPGIDYRGLDPSPYAVQRYGRSRRIGLASFGQLAELRFEEPFDLIVCADVLHYMPAAEVRRGLSGFAELLRGMAFIEVYAKGDAIEGDQENFVARSAAWYRRAFAEAGLTPCGSHGYLGPELAGTATALERL